MDDVYIETPTTTPDACFAGTGSLQHLIIQRIQREPPSVEAWQGAQIGNMASIFPQAS